MQKIVFALTLVACAGVERDADSINSLATLLLSRSPTESFNPSTSAAGSALRKPAIASSLPVAMKADNSELSLKSSDLTPQFAQAAGLLAAMMPLMALAEDGDGLKITALFFIAGYSGVCALYASLVAIGLI